MFTLLPGARTVPIYTYTCTSCNEVVEKRQSFTDAPLTTCEQCGGTLRKVIHPVGIVFKGSGWYSTDSRASSSATRSSGTDTSSSDSKGSKDSESKDSSSTKDSGSKDSSSSKESGSKDSGSKDSSAKPASAPAAASTPSPSSTGSDKR